MSDPRLTIVMPLKGRPLHTLRFLRFAARQRMPYHIIIADGEVREPLASVMEDYRRFFPELSVEYIRNPDDASYGIYLSKMANALSRVATPYVMVVDNDDFLMSSGFGPCMDFLDVHPDYVACTGRRGGFNLLGSDDALNNIAGEPVSLDASYSDWDNPRDIDAPSLTGRISQLFDGYRTGDYYDTYYSITRTGPAQQVFQEEVAIGFTDAEIREAFHMIRTISFGKAITLPGIFTYARQHGTSIRTENTNGHVVFKRDWVDLILNNRFSSDFGELLDRVSKLAEAQDGTPVSQTSDTLRELYGRKLRADLRVRFYTEHWLIAALKKVRGLARSMQQLALPRAMVRSQLRRRYNNEVASIVNLLREEGATDGYLANFRDELAVIRNVTDRREFLNFAATIVPSLLPQEKAP